MLYVFFIYFTCGLKLPGTIVIARMNAAVRPWHMCQSQRNIQFDYLTPLSSARSKLQLQFNFLVHIINSNLKSIINNIEIF